MNFYNTSCVIEVYFIFITCKCTVNYYGIRMKVRFLIFVPLPDFSRLVQSAVERSLILNVSSQTPEQRDH